MYLYTHLYIISVIRKETTFVVWNVNETKILSFYRWQGTLWACVKSVVLLQRTHLSILLPWVGEEKWLVTSKTERRLLKEHWKFQVHRWYEKTGFTGFTGACRDLINLSSVEIMLRYICDVDASPVSHMEPCRGWSCKYSSRLESILYKVTQVCLKPFKKETAQTLSTKIRKM